MGIFILIIVLLFLTVLAIRFWFIVLPLILLCHFLLIEKPDKSQPEKVSFWVGYKNQAKIPVLIVGLIVCIAAIALIPLLESNKITGWFYLMFGVGSVAILISANPQSEPEPQQEETPNVENSDDSSKDTEKWQKTFGIWTKEELSRQGQEERYRRSNNNNMKIISTDDSTGITLIVGTQGVVYDVTLNSCNCPDFMHRRLPCKHIYLLARKKKLI